MRPPKLVKPYVRRFCEAIVRDAQPQFIRTRPMPGAAIHDCFVTVAQQVERHGGDQQIGWAIWEWPRVFIEAEFHCVWRSPEGSLVDVSARPIHVPRVLFLPDPARAYEGRQVDNIRKPLDRDPRIKRFLDLAHLMFVEVNRGELADYHGQIEATQQMLRYQREQAALYLLLQRRYGVNSPESDG